MPEDMPDRMPEAMPDRMSDRMPEGMPDKVPECLPEHMPKDLPDKMPDRMSEDIAEDLPDRMPEDLPGTKRIDVMVGITRSQVIFPIILGMSSSQLTNSYFSEGLKPPTRHCIIPYNPISSHIIPSSIILYS